MRMSKKERIGESRGLKPSDSELKLRQSFTEGS